MSSIQPPLTAAPAPAHTPGEAARGLERYLVKQWLDAAQIGEGLGLGSGVAADTFRDMLEDALADQLADSGELGLREALADQLEPERMQSTPLASRPVRRMVAAYQPSGHLSTRPVEGRLTSDFGARVHPITGHVHHHDGLDIAAPEGAPVVSAGAGTVVRAEPAGGYGNLVVVDHGGGVETRYAHLAEISVQVGDTLSAGDTVGAVGSTGRSTGPHLHFEVRRSGRPEDPFSAVPALNAAPNRSR